MKNILQVINRLNATQPESFIAECEGEYIRRIDEIAKKIDEDDDIKIVSIAGPSSAGKTTTAHILCDDLEKRGENTAVVSLDDFYLPEDRLPILPDGRRDIESVNALDIQLIKECFNNIITTGKTILPNYDFKTRTRISAAKTIDIGERGIVIVEGLHALNPLITELVPAHNIFKIYISVNRPIVDENGCEILSSRQIRLIRRSLRDEVFRNASIKDTLSLWEGVVEGEAKYLYCFKDTADIQLVTLHPYELGLYRTRFLKMRDQVDKGTPCYEYFIKTAKALELFEPLEHSLVPKDSLIREFIGQD